MSYQLLKRYINKTRSAMPKVILGREELLRHRFNPSKYICCHGSDSRNFGDAINRLTTGAIAHRTPILASTPFVSRKQLSYAVIGSTLHFDVRQPFEVWGAGFLNEKARFKRHPLAIHAVRGPLTRERCLDQGVNCAPIYGDPAVFYFTYLREKFSAHKKYLIGLIPHYSDRQHPKVLAFARRDDVKLIDVYDRPEKVVQDAMSCEYIISSSLHGLILADCLNVPSRWLGVTPYALQGGFKFQDYFLSVQREEVEPLHIDELTKEKVLSESQVCRKAINQDLLLAACPFKSPDIHTIEDIHFAATAEKLYRTGYFRAENYWGPIKTSLKDWRELSF